jgi:hypothetical protein
MMNHIGIGEGEASSREETTIHAAFICLLHLANEKSKFVYTLSSYRPDDK